MKKMLFMLICLFPVINSCEEESLSSKNNNVQSIDVTLEFPYFNPDSIKMFHSFNGWDSVMMQFETQNKLKLSFPFSTGDHKINFYYWMHYFPNCSQQWLEHGWISNDVAFRYAILKINNITINNSYIKDNTLGGSNVAINIASDGTITPGSGTLLPINENIPPEVTHPRHYVGNIIPPAGYTNVIGWMQALHDRRYDNEVSKVEVKYMKLYAKVGGVDVLLKDDRYISGTSQNGGLYFRYPFFAGCDYHTSLPNYINSSDSVMVLEPNQTKDRVYHWWNSGNSTIPLGATSFKLVCEVKVTGHAVVQGGIDFKQSAPQGIESGTSDWYIGSSAPQIFTVIYDSSN